jgi:hypothetical protein
MPENSTSWSAVASRENGGCWVSGIYVWYAKCAALDAACLKRQLDEELRVIWNRRLEARR